MRRRSPSAATCCGCRRSTGRASACCRSRSTWSRRRPNAREARDFFGNGLTPIAFAHPHEELVLRTTARIDVTPPPVPSPGRRRRWETVRDSPGPRADLGPRSPVHHLFPSRRLPMVPEITAYAAVSFPHGRPILAAAFELTCRIKADFAYDPDATDVDHAASRRPSREARRLPGLRPDHDRRPARAGPAGGLCQRLPAHRAAAGAGRAWKARTPPTPGSSLWCGRAPAGSASTPPTPCLPGDDHIVLAVGRDYADVAPVDGVIIATGDHALDVAVDVVPVDAPAASGLA